MAAPAQQKHACLDARREVDRVDLGKATGLAWALDISARRWISW
jgi:hypothetical protein